MNRFPDWDKAGEGNACETTKDTTEETRVWRLKRRENVGLNSFSPLPYCLLPAFAEESKCEILSHDRTFGNGGGGGGV